MIHKKCLNCGSLIDTPYCPQCGQSIRTRRFRFNREGLQEALMKVLNLEKGLGYTVWSLFRQPGTMVRSYLMGERKRYMHYLSLLLTMVVLDYLIQWATGYDLTKVIGDKEAIRVYSRFLRENTKLYLLIVLPINALFTYWFFRKVRFNLAEHLVINTYLYSGQAIIGLFIPIAMALSSGTNLESTLMTSVQLVQLLYSVVLYYQLFRPFYRRKVPLVLRSLLCVLFVIFLSQALIMIGLAVYEGIKQSSGG
ncbi:DUF3667 domain-containing protein [Phaeodactylibacter sp.]|uniref:DUF3667 domain-containing protein n=1 Tax=Phaeodactylibacter sp. TaxID=1940289 RepID=UPI0025CFF4F8|nr:DUF3667 domain-containing protein [Phaeodactylibacter sp.]MCI4648238.1 DUF3667 domain-containing protein [Phaeodactylibacter sp.]MCI5091907.1 DUF3667 domain-containing protein [Phaeodactylibacter sp.]